MDSMFPTAKGGAPVLFVATLFRLVINLSYAFNLGYERLMYIGPSVTGLSKTAQKTCCTLFRPQLSAKLLKGLLYNRSFGRFRC